MAPSAAAAAMKYTVKVFVGQLDGFAQWHTILVTWDPERVKVVKKTLRDDGWEVDVDVDYFPRLSRAGA